MAKWESGFSLVQGMILASALAGMALVGSKMSQTQKVAVNDVKSRDAVEQVHAMIYSILQNRQHCLATLGATEENPPNPPYSGHMVRTGAIRPVYSIVLNTTQTSSAEPFRVSGGSAASTYTYLNGQVKIANMTLTFPADLSNHLTLTIDYLRGDGGFGANRTKSRFGGKNVRKEIPIALERSSSNQVKGCTAVEAGGSVTTQDAFEEFCNDYEYTTWDDTLKTCVVKQNICNPGEVFNGIDANGDKICRPFISYLPAIFDTRGTVSNPWPVNTCPDDYNEISVTREGTENAKLTFECNKTGVTCRSNYWQDWYGADGSRCQVNIPRREHGQSVDVADTNSPGTGSVRYSCVNGVWNFTPLTDCTAPCSAQTSVSWSASGSSCSGPLPDAPNGTYHLVTQTTATKDGGATYRCVQGTWQLQSSPGRYCNQICPAVTSISWSQDADVCSVSLPQGNQGNTTSALNTTSPNRIGKARFTCNGGSWTLLSSYTPTCEVVGSTPGGICSWSGTVTWEYPCYGFQVSAGLADSVVVPNKAACKAECQACKAATSTSYSGCLYTPNP